MRDTYFSCTRYIQFCAGHRVLGHGGKCVNAHGHNYVAEITAQQVKDPRQLDNLGMVVDFTVIKKLIGTWIDEYWDHKFILHQDDSELIEAFKRIRMPYFLLPYNPTAENLAQYLLERFSHEEVRAYGFEVVAVSIQETPNCLATVNRFNLEGV